MSNLGVLSDVDVKDKISFKRPKNYHCVLLNDDYTPMEFVVGILIKIFHHSHEDAVNIMLQIHHQGEGIAGTYSEEVAQEKCSQVVYAADAAGYPLQSVVRESDSE